MTALRDDAFWQTKLHARLHDPAEKALVLLRDPAGHEGGTCRALHRDLGFDRLGDYDVLPPDHPDALHTAVFRDGVPLDMYKLVKRADWWASAADRPQWPLEEIEFTARDGTARTRKVADWAQVRWSKDPILVHPLSGKTFDLRTLRETDIDDIKTRSHTHFSNLVMRDGDAVDWRRTALAFWRFGPELAEEGDGGKLGSLWPLLPADTRVPDHSIWDHLDLTSAFAGAFAADEDDQASLLSVAIGPVQGFIAAARTTSDLWAGSHLLSRMAWEAMRVVCERLGPDAILFPRLRGLPQVDVWLHDVMNLDAQWFKGCSWRKSRTDANPLFAAALPNRFAALVPKDSAAELANAIKGRVRNWLQETGARVVRRLAREAGVTDDGNLHAYGQMREQLAGFPEVHWSATPFSLVKAHDRSRDTNLDTTTLAQAMAPFFGEDGDQPQPGFLRSPAWRAQSQDAAISESAFFSPNPGVLYPAIHDLGERVLAAAKAARPFEPLDQHGWRCSLTGETEWLTTDAAQLARSYRSQPDTLWAKIAEQRPAWAKKGEHLGGLSAVKRLWPTLFAEEVKEHTASGVDRFVVSTHTMALAGNLEDLHEKLSSGDTTGIEKLLRSADRAPALPRRLCRLRGTLAARIPAAFDRLHEGSDEHSERDLALLETVVEEHIGHKPEAYYALLLFDGDHMGRILAGEHDDCAVSYLDSFHPKVRAGFKRHARDTPALARYGDQARAISPGRHLAISAALNDFAVRVVPHIVEQTHRGRVIYAGGDDVLAMLPVGDMLSAMRRLRDVYSGEMSYDKGGDWRDASNNRGILLCKAGFALLDGRLMRMMAGATASCGAVVAHHQAPLGSVLRELRAAEQRAKNDRGRDAFSISVIKRSGGDLRFSAKWDDAALLSDVCDFLRQSASRRAVYNSVAWLGGLPDDADASMLDALLAQQFRRHLRRGMWSDQDAKLVQRLAQFATCKAGDWLNRLRSLLAVAEFLARGGRSATTEQPPDAADGGV